MHRVIRWTALGLATLAAAESASAWAGASVDAQASLNGVSCASAALCVAVDDNGNALVSTTPGSSMTY